MHKERLNAQKGYFSVPLDDLANGLYLMVIYEHSGKKISRKFVVQNN
jgi:hypothetical protein